VQQQTCVHVYSNVHTDGVHVTKLKAQLLQCSNVDSIQFASHHISMSTLTVYTSPNSKRSFCSAAGSVQAVQHRADAAAAVMTGHSDGVHGHQTRNAASAMQHTADDAARIVFLQSDDKMSNRVKAQLFQCNREQLRSPCKPLHLQQPSFQQPARCPTPAPALRLKL
jgi:hypothetical protein